jgi:hypothetical protein
VELEMLLNEGGNVPEVVGVALSESVLDLHSCLVRGTEEVLNEEVLSKEGVCGALIDEDGGRGNLG